MFSWAVEFNRLGDGPHEAQRGVGLGELAPAARAVVWATAGFGAAARRPFGAGLPGSSHSHRSECDA